MPREDTWDWPVLLYVGTVILRRSERAFWKMTPRKMNALTKAHIKLKGGDQEGQGQQTKQGFIDHVI